MEKIKIGRKPAAGRQAVLQKIKTLGLTQAEAESAIELILGSISDGLVEDGKVVCSGFGTFSVRVHRPRMIKMPGQVPRKIPARCKIRFKSSPTVFRNCR